MKFLKKFPGLVQLPKEITGYNWGFARAGDGKGVYARGPNNKKAFVNEM